MVCSTTRLSTSILKHLGLRHVQGHVDRVHFRKLQNQVAILMIDEVGYNRDMKQNYISKEDILEKNDDLPVRQLVALNTLHLSMKNKG